ncbi:MAG TPA: neuraminidase-like domain-containing protein, partial [Pyrinomonadaceae bacterium]
EFELSVSAVRDTLRVQWERDGIVRTAVPPSALYPATALRAARATYTRFLKAASLAKSLGLTAAETAQHTPPAPSWLNALPVEGDAPNPAALLPHLRALLDYARLKSEISPDDESLLAFMRYPVAAAAQTDGPLYTLARWDAASLGAFLTHFGSSAGGLSNVNFFRRVHDAFALTRKMGITADALIAAATNEPTSLVVRDLQAALRARYDAEVWREVVKPVNDQMRARRRDALVACILQRMRSDPSTAHVDTPDKLFEYFLMDVQMEPCMLTSRIRHALSTVQLFVERSLLGLEPRVAPASLNAKQWEWMSRYRLWEANRKVFLFPENWIEPELRDDKSPIFKEVESELLQSDITEETAAAALLNYLSKLEEIAKLEPCGIHHVDADPAMRTGEVDHVIARTAGGHRRYYYRRREFGLWTPWEHVKLDIEDNPVAPVVWRGRLLLFWLRVMQQGVVDKAAQGPSAKPGNTTPGSTLGELAADAKDSAKTKMAAQAVLCWSEFYNGKWQPAHTSEVERPAELGKFFPAGPGAFQRSALRLRFDEEGDALRVGVYGGGNASFLLYNTHSLPAHGASASGGKKSVGGMQLVAINVAEWREFTGAVGDLTLTYGSGMVLLGGGLTRHVLKPLLPPKIVEPHHRLADPWGAPFFLEDWRHVFFVTTAEEPVLVKDSFDYGVAVNPGGATGVSFTPQFQAGGAAGRQFVTEDAALPPAAGPAGGVWFGGTLIGPGGALGDAQAAPDE